MNGYYIEQASAAAPVPLPEVRSRAAAWTAVLAMAFLAIHIPLAYAMHTNPLIATMHLFLVLFVGLMVVSAPR